VACAVGIALACGILALPLPYKVSGKCSVQPETRRFVVAPYEGMLKEALVEPGDVVSAAQVVARMDERDIEWELAGLQAEASQAQKQRDANLAGRDTAATQLSALEMQRLEVKSRQLRHRASNLEIRSPVDGVVISGDPKKMEGARLTIGQTLLEIGPLDEMVVEVSIPDEDISHVQPGQQVSLRLEAQPTRRHRGVITKIHPRAVTKDQANVFLAEVRLENIDGTLRPGMNGRAQVHTDRHPLGWNLFHKVWQRVAFRMGW
jgi:RND family efflux transporter MFP subunit